MVVTALTLKAVATQPSENSIVLTGRVCSYSVGNTKWGLVNLYAQKQKGFKWSWGERGMRSTAKL